MAVSKNNMIISNHFRKDWQRRVATHFNQPGAKLRRRQARQAKAAKLAPRPVDKLRPVVRCPTVKYNRRVRAGRGFSLAELKEAGIPRKLASTIGIAVDPRRQNLSEESLKANVERLKAYRARLILFPRKSRKAGAKQGDATEEQVKAAREGGNVASIAKAFKIGSKAVIETGKISDYEGTKNAYATLRQARSDARYAGKREKRAKAKAEEAAAAKK